MSNRKDLPPPNRWSSLLLRGPRPSETVFPQILPLVGVGQVTAPLENHSRIILSAADYQILSTYLQTNPTHANCIFLHSPGFYMFACIGRTWYWSYLADTLTLLTVFPNWLHILASCWTTTRSQDSTLGSRYDRSSLDYLTAIIRLYSEPDSSR